MAQHTPKQVSRRHFLQASALTSTSACLPSALANPPKKKLGVALVGLGYYSRDLLAPSLQLTEHCELRGIVTGTPSKIPIWQKKYGIKDANVYNYQTLPSIANNPDIDVVYIVLPTFLHHKYSLIAANAGKHLWCEKPMAMTVAECQSIMQACEKNKVQLTIGYRMHHEPNTQTVIKWAKTAPYGPIKSVLAHAGYKGGGGAQDYWRMIQAQGGGALYDMGVYPINAVRYATGLEPTAVSAKHITHRPALFKNADETTALTLEFKNGITADLRTSVGENINHLKVDCAKGWYELNPMQSYTGVKGRASDGMLLDKPIANQQASQMDNDALNILGKGPLRVPGLQGLMDIRVVEGALQSVKTGKRVTLS